MRGGRGGATAARLLDCARDAGLLVLLPSVGVPGTA
jgi:hypothetical protein